MNNKLTMQEAEAVLMLKGSNQVAFNVLISYFDRRYNKARDKCVDTGVEAVQREQGTAKAFREMRNIEEAADEIYKLEKQK